MPRATSKPPPRDRARFEDSGRRRRRRHATWALVALWLALAGVAAALASVLDGGDPPATTSTPPPSPRTSPGAAAPALIVDRRASSTESDGRRYESIQAAVDAARPGMTVLVRGGTYTRQRVTIRTSGVAGRPITVKPYPGEDVIIDGGARPQEGADLWFDDAGLVSIKASHIVFEGFEVKNSPTHGIHAVGDHIVLRGNLSHHHYLNGIETWADHVVIERNEVHSTSLNNFDNRADGWAGGLTTQAREVGRLARDVTVRDNVIHAIWGEGLNVLRADGFHIVGNTVRNVHSVSVLIESVNGIVEDNTIVYDGAFTTSRRPRAFAWGAEDHWTYPEGLHHLENIVIRDNLFVDQADAAFVRLSDPLTYSDVRITGNTFKGTGIHADPMINGTGSGNVLTGNVIEGEISIADESAWTIGANDRRVPSGDEGDG